MPGEDDLPAGPHRDLVAALHDLYRRSGMLSTRALSEAVKRCDECPDTLSHEGVSVILHGKGISGWPKLESLVRVLAMRAVDKPVLETTIRAIHALWLKAVELPPRAMDLEFPQQVSKDLTVNEDTSGATGDLNTLRYAVDIVLCIDITASMQPVIDEVKSGAFSFHSQLSAVMRRRGKRVSQMRIRVIAYRDFGDNPNDALRASPFFKMPDQVRSFELFMRSLSTFGGGDEPESGLEALSVAIDSDWERGMGVRRHVIVVFTDASAHPLGGPARIDAKYPPGIPETFDQLSERWGHPGGQTSVMEYRAKRLLLFAPDISPWNTMADEWNNVIFFPSQAGNGLSEFELKEVLDAISGSI
jgi:hypothetical protein